MSDEQLRYPIGRFIQPAAYTAATRAQAITTIGSLPRMLRAALAGAGDAELDTPYRPGGWTGRQVVHHIADSHLNAFTRLRLALTEETPVIKPYDEAAWAELPDAKTGPLAPSLHLITGVHERWEALLRTLTPEQFARTWRHPDREGTLTVDFLVAMYAWHGEHHLAHILHTARD